MAISDFDIIVDIIEDDTTLNWKQVETRIKNALHMNYTELCGFFRVTNPEGNTLKQYYDFRRVCNAMNDFVKQNTLESIAEKYNYTDAAHLSTQIKQRLGKSPKFLLEEGYECPKAQYLVDILQEIEILKKGNTDYLFESKERINRMSLNEEKYKHELISAIDSIIDLQNENEKLKEIIRRNKIEEQTKGKQIDMLMLSQEIYEEFLKIENCRVVYDKSMEDIIGLYHQSIKTGKPLEDLCINLDDIFEIKKEIEAMDVRSKFENVGDLEEVWREYFVDDDPADCESDPYRTEEYMLDDYSTDDEYDDYYYEDDDSNDYDIERIILDIKNETITGAGNIASSKVLFDDDENVPF